jgi:hypothetical protein
MDTVTIIVIVACSILVVPLLWYVHCGLERCYIRFGHRFCKSRGLTVSRFRCGPEFEDSGIKTENSIVEFDCIAPDGARQLVKLRVWIFGIRKVLRIEAFPKDQEAETEEATQQIHPIAGKPGSG